MHSKRNVWAVAALAALVVGLTTWSGCSTLTGSAAGDSDGLSDYTSDSYGEAATEYAGEAGTGSSAEDTTGDDTSGIGDDGSDGEIPTPQAGTLTAGSFDDNLNYETFTGFVDEVLSTDTEDAYPDFPLGQRIIITVVDGDGNPVPDARVVVTAADKSGQQQQAQSLLDQTTGTDGRVLLLTGLDGGSDATSFEVETFYPAVESTGVTETRDLDTLDWEITLADATGAAPTKLDLAFVVDATGSMGDEMEYLKSEVRGIAEDVADLFPDVSQRLALIVYRDVGDIYVTRMFDFATLDEFITNLEDQNAGGGGDWPEAVHEALGDASGLSWGGTGTARVLFHIADAPPHTEHAQDTLDAIQVLRKAGVAIYPVAASGVETELEFYMRAAAFLTLSEYIFLTDDSGVGNAHAQPHIPCYQVQYLNDLMVRMVATELAGHRIEPEAADVLRTVGNPVNGVCGEVPDDQDQDQDQDQDEQTQ